MFKNQGRDLKNFSLKKKFKVNSMKTYANNMKALKIC